MRFRMIVSLAALSFGLLACNSSDSGTPESLLVRKEVLELSPTEVSQFVSALKAMKTIPSAYDDRFSAYDYFVDLHMRAFSMEGMEHGVHMGSNFLPWHREMLHRFELEMRRASGNPSLTLPYWDWTSSASTQRLFQNDFLGGDGDPTDDDVVKTGPFRIGEWEIFVHDPTGDEFDGTPDPVSGRALTREFGVNLPTLPGRSQLDRAMSAPMYDVAPFNMNADITQSFRNAVEGWWPKGSRMHNQVHVYIGGAMETGASPNDPAFFLHHNNIDRIWASWQAKNGNSTVPEFVTTGHLYEFGEVTGGSTFNLSAMGVKFSKLVP